MPNIDTTDHDLARLYGDIKQLDNNIVTLEKSTMFNKAEAAEAVIKQTRILLGHIVLTMHSIKNELERNRQVKG